ncbi:hypothetical protein IQ255_25650 [Pleurocapsales cyanobacterium LEGE 10410]|nr:hypothetical protein [Pleurocapsales cyanobacterium LEGE 10410]
MTKNMGLNMRLLCTGIVTLLMCSYLTWEYFHGGVTTHYIYIFENLPGISNWWGVVILPLLTWFLAGRIQKRVPLPDHETTVVKHIPKSVLLGFLWALLLGILISIFFTYGNTRIPMAVMLSMILLALFIPLYRAEYFLGFVLGMTYTFGPVLPIGIGGVLITLIAITYRVFRPVWYL